MGGHRVQRSATAVVAVAATALPAVACQSPVPFYPAGAGAPDAPVVGLGGPAPYVRSPAPSGRPGAHGTTPAPRRDPSARAVSGGGNVYAATGPSLLQPAAQALPPRLFVPNGSMGTVDVVDLRTFRVTARLRTGGVPRRVVASWDLRRLWVTDARSGTLTPLSPLNGRRGRPVATSVPGGRIHFTPDGGTALVMAGRQRRIDIRDPGTMQARGRLVLPCAGAEHADFSATGAFLVTGCTPSGRLLRVDPALRQVTGTLALPEGAAPGAVRLAPDGRSFYVADAARGGVWVIDAGAFQVSGFVPTRPGAYSLTFSRDARRLYVLGTGVLTAVDLAARRATGHWRLPGGGSPEAGGVTADGTALWLCEPRTGGVYALSTRTGRLVRTVRIGGVPQGGVVYPQPGRHSLGGSGIYR